MPVPPSPRRTNRGLLVGIIGAALLVGAMVLAVTVVAPVLDEPQQLTSANQVVGVRIPADWDDLTSGDAGKDATGADPDEPTVIPDLEASDFEGDSHLTVWVEDAVGTQTTTVHRALVADVCEQDGCLSRGDARQTTVAGRHAIRELLTHPESRDWGTSTTLVVTVDRGNKIVTLTVWTDEYATVDVEELLRSVTLPS